MDQTAKLSVVGLEAPSLPTADPFEAIMRRIAITLVALVGAAAAFAAPAAAYETDPLTGQPIQNYYSQQPYYGQQYSYGQQPEYGQQPSYDQTYRPQATTIPREV